MRRIVLVFAMLFLSFGSEAQTDYGQIYDTFKSNETTSIGTPETIARNLDTKSFSQQQCNYLNQHLITANPDVTRSYLKALKEERADALNNCRLSEDAAKQVCYTAYNDPILSHEKDTLYYTAVYTEMVKLKCFSTRYIPLTSYFMNSKGGWPILEVTHQYLIKAADLGHVASLESLGKNYSKLESHKKQGFIYLMKAHDNGSTVAATHLSQFHNFSVTPNISPVLQSTPDNLLPPTNPHPIVQTYPKVIAPAKVTAPTITQALNKIGYVTANSLNARDAPKSNGQSLGKINYGTKIRILELNENWGRVFLDNGRSAWVHMDYVSDKKPALKPKIAKSNKITKNRKAEFSLKKNYGIALGADLKVPMNYCTTCRQGFTIVELTNFGSGNVHGLTKGRDSIGTYYIYRKMDCRRLTQKWLGEGTTPSRAKKGLDDSNSRSVSLKSSNTSAIAKDVGSYICQLANG